MNRDRYINSRRDDWQRLANLLARLQSEPQSAWSGRDIAEFSRLYRSVCYDLSLVQSREWGIRLEHYLNDLVARGHNFLYRAPPHSLHNIWQFFSAGFPRLLRSRWKPLLLAFCLFTIPLLICVRIGQARPDLAELIAGREAIDNAISMYRDRQYQDADERYLSERSLVTGFYVSNNTGIAFQAYGLGILAGIGTCWVLLSNGISIGIIMGSILAEGHRAADNFFSFVITHGAFELTAIVIAGTGGFILARGILMPGHRTRGDSIRSHGRDSLLLALGAGAMLCAAALLEGFFSPLPIDSHYKYVTGAALWALVMAWLSLGGRESRTS